MLRENMDDNSIPKDNMHPTIKCTKDFVRCPLEFDLEFNIEKNNISLTKHKTSCLSPVCINGDQCKSGLLT